MVQSIDEKRDQNSHFAHRGLAFCKEFPLHNANEGAQYLAFAPFCILARSLQSSLQISTVTGKNNVSHTHSDC
jgi:hypothetical protein